MPDSRRFRAATLALLVPAAVGMTGCSVDYYADRIIEPNAWVGKADQALLGTGPQLLAVAKITAHKRIAAGDGTEIDTWLIAASPFRTTFMPPRGTVVFLHGLGDSKARYWRLARRMSDLGYDAVLLDFRAHGRSGGKYVTWGAREKYDVKSVVSALLAEEAISAPIYVFGHSMGAAVAVMYAAIDPRCRGVLAVAPYRDARSVTRRVVPMMSDEKFEQAWHRAGEKARFDPSQTSTVDAAAELRCPLVVVHGGADSIVPEDHGRAVYEAAAAPKRLVVVPLAGHVSVVLAREKWVADQIHALATDPPRKN